MIKELTLWMVGVPAIWVGGWELFNPDIVVSWSTFWYFLPFFITLVFIRLGLGTIGYRSYR